MNLISNRSCVSLQKEISCHHDGYSNGTFCNEFNSIPYVYFSTSIVSCLCCILVFLTYNLLPRLWGYSSRVFLLRTSLDFIISIAHIFLFAFFLHSLEHHICQGFGVLFEFLLIAANFWYFLLAYDLIRAIRNPFGSGSNNGLRSHITVWTASVIMSVLLLVSLFSKVGPGVSMFYFCWISVQEASLLNFGLWSLFVYYLPHFFFWFVSLIVNLIAFCILFGRFPASSETRRHILKQNAFYVLVLGLETILIIPLWILQMSFLGEYYSDRSTICFMDKGSLSLAYIFAIIHSLRGTVDLFVWWITFSIGPKDFNKIWLRYKAWRYRDLYLTTPDNLHTPLISVEQSRVNKVLRKDVIFCINYGILDAVRLNAEEENQRTHLGSVRDPFMAQVMLKYDEEVYQQEAEERYTDPKYQEVHQRRIPFHPSNNLKDFAFIDIEPTIFGLLRNSYGLNPLTYQQSFTIKDDQDVESSGMLEKFTEGKSGSFFYFTRDYRYIIKTVTTEEEQFLQKIAFRYYNYMQRNPDSVIVRLYGLHKVRLAREQRYISVVVMDNLFHNEQSLKMNQRYDLKGSRIGRRVLKGNEKPSERYKKTLKDLDLSGPVVIGPEAKTQLMEQLTKDVEFLSSLHIMDYSMLLGVHHHNNDVNGFHYSMPVEYEPGDDFTQVTFGGSIRTPATEGGGESKENVPFFNSYSSSPGSTLERGAVLASLPPRRQTYSSVFSDDLEESCDDSIESVRPPYVPWYRRDFGGLRSFCPHHPLNLEYQTNGSLSIVIPEEGYEGLNIENLPNNTYYFGIVDILQVYNWDKKVENFTKTKILRKDKDGISAIDENRYAKRFLEAMDRIFV